MEGSRLGRLAVLLGLLSVLLTPAGAEGIDDPCARPEAVDGVGLACRLPDGLLQVISPDGEPLGTTHGPDPAPTLHSPSFATPPAVDPWCVTQSASTYNSVVIYARAADDASANVSDPVGTVRDLVKRANGYLRQGAASLGGYADLRVACLSGAITVHQELLPTPAAKASFSTIVADLMGRGYSDPRKKYWVFYDDKTACACGGVGHVYDDDRASVHNWNNGDDEVSNPAPMFAVNFGYTYENGNWGPLTMLHELSHTMGAVQLSAPHTTGARHCTDGYDVMCYDDGGPNGWAYTTTACPTDYVYDCGKDDYFHLDPPAGSYLDGHWNIGADINRFLEFANAAPVMTSLNCPATVSRDASASCSFSADDRSPGVAYLVAWGDGTTNRIPATGYLPPNQVATATHAYAAFGSFVVSVTPVDDHGLAGTPKTRTVTVTDLEPPVISLEDPIPGRVYVGCATSVVGAGAPAYVSRGCVRAVVTDRLSSVSLVRVWLDGRVVAQSATPTSGTRWVFDFPVRGPVAGAPLRVEALDAYGNPASRTVSVNVL